MPRAKAPATEAVEVLERFDPSQDSVPDGDPAFEFMLSEKDADKHYVWANQHEDPRLDNVQAYKAKRYRIANAEEAQMLSGLQFEPGETPRVADHILMVRDREYHEKSTARERKVNRETRAQMLSKKRIEGDVFVPAPNGNGPRAMQQR